MIDGNLLFSLELCALVVLIGAGVWRIYRILQSARINPSAPVASAPVASAWVASAPLAYDMRRDGQRLGLQTDTR